MGTLTTMKFDGSRTMHKHVIEMINITAKLEYMELNVNENFLVTFIMNSLPSHYGQFQINYNIIKNKWNFHYPDNQVKIASKENLGLSSETSKFTYKADMYKLTQG
ncbi:hypothetical protein RJ641_023251 [Dillenia turbinata]|uniref:Uncharacterized protein n=1 Tax=Dillenia turbinata TaxID=194707 RepID=A0AAN8UIG0_9MAGN